MLLLKPIVGRLLRKLGRSPPLHAVADESVTLAPASVVESKAVIHLAEDLERVQEGTVALGREQFRARLGHRDVLHPETSGYRYADAWIIGSTVYAGAALRQYREDRRLLASGTPVDLRGPALATDESCEKYFGHWLLDGLSKELLAQEHGFVPIGLERPAWTQEPGYRARVDMRAERYPLAHVRDLWILDDRAINRDRARRIHMLRERVRRPEAAASGRPVFLRRVGGRERRLCNQEELAGLLATRGFVVLTPEETPVEELVAAIRGARLVVSVEGSALCHGIAGIADGGTICAIQPPNRFDWVLKGWIDAADLRFAFTVADPADGGFTLPPERLLRVIDLIGRENPF